MNPRFSAYPSLLTRRDALLGGLGLAAGGLLAAATAWGETLVALAVVIAREHPLNALDYDSLRQIYLGHLLVGPEGKRLIALNQVAGSIDRVQFDRIVLKMNPSQTGQYWIQQRALRHPSPRSVDGALTLRRVVAKLWGSLGYLRPAYLVPELKALRIDGKLPGEAGYPLVFPQ